MNSLTRRSFLSLAGSAAALSAAGNPKPNFVFILADDLGWTDLACYGSRFYETPNIDRLAAGGMRFTQAYSGCTVCSPSRAAVLTGKYSARTHVTDWIPGYPYPYAKLRAPEWTQYLPLNETTVAESLHEAGYATASIGKWHLGGPPYYPEKQGFDRNVGGTNGGQPPGYFAPYKISTLRDGPPGEYLTDREGIEAERFLEENQNRPFFLYLPFHAVHIPVEAKKEAIAHFESKADPRNPQHHAGYAALIQGMDEAIGRVMKALDRLKLTDNTVVVFTSDNGGLLETTSNVPLRDGKGSAYEGGVRVPLIVRWPGHVRPGSRCDVPVASIDHYPTLLEMAGLGAAGGSVDGRSLMPLLQRRGRFAERPLFWHYPHYHVGGATPYSAVRQGDWRLVEFYEDQHVELYNLAKDVGESQDLAGREPKRAAMMREMLHRWRRSVGAQDPVPNPAYDPAKARKPQ